MAQTFEEYCVEKFLDSIESIDLCEYEFPTLDIATKVAEGLSEKWSKGFTFYIFKNEECDFYSVDYFMTCDNAEESFREIYGNVEVFKTIETT